MASGDRELWLLTVPRGLSVSELGALSVKLKHGSVRAKPLEVGGRTFQLREGCAEVGQQLQVLDNDSLRLGEPFARHLQLAEVCGEVGADVAASAKAPHIVEAYTAVPQREGLQMRFTAIGALTSGEAEERVERAAAAMAARAEGVPPRPPPPGESVSVSATVVAKPAKGAKRVKDEKKKAKSPKRGKRRKVGS